MCIQFHRSCLSSLGHISPASNNWRAYSGVRETVYEIKSAKTTVKPKVWEGLSILRSWSRIMKKEFYYNDNNCWLHTALLLSIQYLISNRRRSAINKTWKLVSKVGSVTYVTLFWLLMVEWWFVLLICNGIEEKLFNFASDQVHD